jgi:type II secretory pathway pseudopilin PulG
MLVVVAIIVVLAGIGATILLPQLERAKEDAARVKATEVKHAAELYYKDHDQFPANVQILAQRDEGLGAGYISEDATKDPWGREFQIQDLGNGQCKVMCQQRPNGHVIESK